jgi:hypothetical protein
MPTWRFRHFEDNISRARDLVALGQSVGAMTIGRVDASDMYRAGLVQGVAALDHYIHGVILDRSVDILLSRIPAPNAASKIGLPVSAVQEILGAPTAAEREQAARTHLVERLAKETYQRSGSIGAGLASVGVQQVWSNGFTGPPGPHLMALDLVVSRRNRISHECDADPANPGSVVPLSAADALDSLTTVENCAKVIDSQL